jgi:hypothetical protein
MVGQAEPLLQREGGSPRVAESLRPALKYGAALLGQASMSLFHFGLNIVLVRRFDPHDYGVFALAFVAAMLGASVTNASTVAFASCTERTAPSTLPQPKSNPAQPSHSQPYAKGIFRHIFCPPE